MHFPSTLLTSLALISTTLAVSLRDTSQPLINRKTESAKPHPSNSLTCLTLPSKPHDKEIRQGKYFKISAFVNKLDNVTSEYFDEYWTKCDIPLALDCKDFTQNVVKFNLIHQTPGLRAELGALGYPTLAYDGIIEFRVKDLVTWQKVTSSQCWQGVRADAQTFSKWPYVFMYGYEVLTFDRI
ncbi:MAG: hypothetical protein Q9200_005122 [Gallowayella weberi]